MTTASTTATSTRPCPLCGQETSVWFRGNPTILRCADCGVGALASVPSHEECVAYYQEEYYDEAQGERFLQPLEWITRGFRWLRVRAILRRVAGPASILDVGCGRGILLELFRNRGWQAVGTQISQTASDAALRRRGVNVFVGELADLARISHHSPAPAPYVAPWTASEPTIRSSPCRKHGSGRIADSSLPDHDLRHLATASGEKCGLSARFPDL